MTFLAALIHRLPQIFATCNHAYRNLTPAQKAKLDELVRWGIEKAVVYGLPHILGDLGERIAREVTNADALLDLTKEVVTRGTKIGVEKALAELRHR